MDEYLWKREADPLVLLDELHPMRSHGSQSEQTRKCRMYLLACARRAWHRLPNVCRTLVKLAEIYAEAPRAQEKLRAVVAPVAEQLMHSDGEPDDFAVAIARLALSDHMPADGHAEATTSGLVPPLTAEEWRGLSALVYLPFEPNTPAFTWVPRNLHSRRLLREVYGKPYQPVPFSPQWRTDTVMSLARQMYDSREFSAMPILADALQDAGCDDGDILVHCRAPEQHVRGCWVLDLVLDLK